MDDENRTIFCGSLSEEVTEEILFELFNQAGPVESVKRPRDPANGRMKSFGFVVFKHDCSVPYAVELFKGTKLFNRFLIMNSRNRERHAPVLDTHFNDPYSQNNTLPSSCGQKKNHDDRRECDSRNHNDRRRYEDNGSRKEYESEPSSWSALKSQGLAANGYNQSDLQNSSRSRSCDFVSGGPPHFNAMLQQGQQMMMPGMLPPTALPNMMPMMGMGMGLGPVLGMGPNMLPSMQGGYSGGRVLPDRHGQQGEHRDDRHGFSDRPYNSMMPMMGMGMGLGPGQGMSPNMLPSMQGGYDGGRVSPNHHSQRGDHCDNRRGWSDRPNDSMMPMMGMGMGLGPGLGMSPNMLPSMQGGYAGGRVSPDSHSHRRDHHNDRSGWRDRPYDKQERRDDHRHQSDRRYSSSRSSHDREHRDRRSR